MVIAVSEKCQALVIIGNCFAKREGRRREIGEGGRERGGSERGGSERGGRQRGRQAKRECREKVQKDKNIEKILKRTL